MPSRSRGRFVLIGVLLVLFAAPAFAQEATISGTITDQTGGVLPGVVVRAVHVESGNNFETVTDSAGGYRLAVRIGTYRLAAEIAGFAPLERTGLQLLVGQQAVVNLQMAPATLQESVTVTGEAPLIDVTASSVGANIDAKQMQELPVNGRNWMDLTLMAAGSRQNSVTETPAGNFQLNVDGQQVTNNIVQTFGQPRFSKDTIAEFEVITNRFDASQGHSSGMQVNAVTKSGTNNPTGTFSGYFRNDRFNAEDFIQKRRIPYSNQQLSTTFGGPIKRDRVHFFLNYEYEHEPQTATHSSPYPSFNIDQQDTAWEGKGGARLDFQFSSKTRLVARYNRSHQYLPFSNSGGASRHPSAKTVINRISNNFTTRLTQVMGNSAVNEVAGSFDGYWWNIDPAINWPNHPLAPKLTHGTPIIMLRGYTIGQGQSRSYQELEQNDPSIRDDYSRTFNRGGRHDVKLGGEYVWDSQPSFLCGACMGILDATGGAVPANIESLFPVWNDVSTWNLRGLSSVSRFYTLGVGTSTCDRPTHKCTSFQIDNPVTTAALWFQDDWAIRSSLTLNLGLRYDYMVGSYGEDHGFAPFLGNDRGHDLDNIAPRLGFAYTLNRQTVIRGGWGIFYAAATHSGVHAYHVDSHVAAARVQNDGRPDFAANPFNGPIPTYEQASAGVTTLPSGVVLQERNILYTLPLEHAVYPFSHQASIGVQRQIGGSASVQADYVYTADRGGNNTIDINLAYNPATGANYPFTDLTKRPLKGWGTANQQVPVPRIAEYKALQLAFTKRMSNHWQASTTYSYGAAWNYQYEPINTGAGCRYPLTTPAPGVFTCDTPITLHPVLQYERFLAGEQHNRATFNGIVELPYGLQVSGLYFYADNGKATPTSGVDVLGTGGVGGRLRANGTLIARNSFDQSDLHRVDLRLQKRLRLTSRVSVDGIVEMFNAFNHQNFGTFVTNESNAQYGRPSFNNNIAYQPRTMQFGFRAAF